MSISVSQFFPPTPNCNDLYGKKSLKKSGYRYMYN